MSTNKSLNECSSCASMKFKHPCVKHSKCWSSNGSGSGGGLQWNPEPCELCSQSLANYRNNPNQNELLTYVMKTSRRHRVKSHFSGDGLLDFFPSAELKAELLPLLDGPSRDPSSSNRASSIPPESK